MQNYELDFEQYVRNAEPAKKEKSYAWSTAIGLQQVDGLTPSKYLFDTARRNIDGEITITEAKSLTTRIMNQSQREPMIRRIGRKKPTKFPQESSKS